MTHAAPLNQAISTKWKQIILQFFCFSSLFSFFWTAFKRLPRRAAFGHHHALEQGDFAALPFRVCQSWLPQVSVSAHQNLLLCSWGIPAPAGGCPASNLLCVLRFYGSPKGQHCAGNPWYVHNHRPKEEELLPRVGEPSLLMGGKLPDEKDFNLQCLFYVYSWFFIF